MTNNTYYKKMFKVATAAAVAAGAVVAVAPSADAAISKFPDVTDQNVHAENIQKLADRNIVQGFPDGTFKPYGNVTRGQAAKIIAGVLGLETDPTKVKDPGFTDLKSTSEYYGPVAALVAVGAISGFTDNTYKAFQPITRVQMAKIIAEAFKLSAGTTVNPFTDAKADTIGDNVAYVNALFATNVTTGTTATTFSPRANVSRGQLASFVIRAEAATKTTTSPGIVVPAPTKQDRETALETGVASQVENLEALLTPGSTLVTTVPSASLLKGLAVNTATNTITIELDEDETLANIKASLEEDQDALTEVVFEFLTGKNSLDQAATLIPNVKITEQQESAALSVEKITVTNTPSVPADLKTVERTLPAKYQTLSGNQLVEANVTTPLHLAIALKQQNTGSAKATLATDLEKISGVTEAVAETLDVKGYLATYEDEFKLKIKYKNIADVTEYTVIIKGV